MTLLDWVGRSATYVQSEGLRTGLRRSADEFRHGAARRIDPYVRGESIFTREWDVLLILDACRPDLLAEVAEQYAFLPRRPETMLSMGSSSKVWMARNFAPEWASELRKTTYVTGNPYSDEYVDANAFASVDEVWSYAWDDERGTIPARAVTDRAIETARQHDPERLLVHYMQPHFPSVPDPVGNGIDLETFGTWDSVWDDLEAGMISRERVWQAYRANLEYVLDDVELLLENLAAETVVISADHGNAFGEWGFYGHPPRNPLPVLRRVPWVETTARDDGSYQPGQTRAEVDVTATDVKSRLEHLGYR